MKNRYFSILMGVYMKIINDLVHKRSIFHIVFIISLLVLTSCERNNETIIEDKSIEIPENNNDPGKEYFPPIVENLAPYPLYRYTLPADGTYTRGHYDMDDNFICSIHDQKMNKENIEIYICEECNKIRDRCKMLFGLEYGGIYKIRPYFA